MENNLLEINNKYQKEKENTKNGDEKLIVSAVEDLMKEHGILNRLLLIYEKFIDMINNNNQINFKLLYASVLIIRRFIEDYHEKTEEKYVFPKVRHINPNLIDELIKQHRESHKITDKLISICQNPNENKNQEEIKTLLELFVYMYRYHETREDTEVFVWFKKSMNKKEYEEMSIFFEKEEEEILGEDGFDKILYEVKFIEKKLNIYDISKITEEVQTRIDRYRKKLI